MKVTDPDILTGLIHERLPDNWGERVSRIDHDAIQVDLAWNDQFAGVETWGESNRPVVSGPIIMGVADTAMYGCCLAAAGPDAVPVIVTITTIFLAPFRPRAINAVATMIRSGRKISHLRCKIGAAGWGSSTAGWSTRAPGRGRNGETLLANLRHGCRSPRC